MLSSAAHALPPDARIALLAGKPHLQKVEGFESVAVEPPSIARAELLPAGELLIEPKAAGVARVFLFGKRIVRVVEVAVGTALPAPSDAAVPAACGSAAEALVVNATCYAAWRARLAGLAAADAPPVRLEEAGVRAQLEAASSELKAKGLGHLQLALTPFGLRVRGAKDEAELRRALIAVWPAWLGPLRLDG